MNMFSISQLSQFSGIKAHTIRIWEQRYNALNPGRSEGNTRYYDNIQLRRLLNIVSLMNYGHKVSELCSLPDEKLFELIAENHRQQEPNEAGEHFIAQLISAGMSYDETQFDKIFSHCLLRQGMTKTYSNIIYPMLIRVGLMWANDTAAPAHEHFISNLIRQKLFTAIDSLPLPKADADKWLLFLPEDEFHDIGLLFANYLIRSSGKNVIYLGNNVPMQSLEIAVAETKPKYLLLLLIHNNFTDDTQNYLDHLGQLSPAETIYISGNERLISQLKTSEKLTWLKTVDDLTNRLST